MSLWHSVLLTVILVYKVNSAVVLNNDEVEEQGLYSKSDHVDILTNINFEKKIYGQSHALVVQFYNSYCGHCRAFAPRFKTMAGEIINWKNIVQLAVIDCSVEENNEICRQFEVMAYPSIRYLHEFYVKGNGNVGDKIQIAESPEKLKAQLISKLQNEQSLGRLRNAPALSIESYSSYAAVLVNNPSDITYTFVVLENVNSTVGSELALDINDYPHVRVKRAYDTSEISSLAKVKQFPAIIAISSSLQVTPLAVTEPNKQSLLQAANTFLSSKNYVLPAHHQAIHEANKIKANDKPKNLNTDLVYYSDLEKTLKTSLHTEITRHKTLSGEPRQALLKFLEIIINSFPFRGNLRDYIVDLHSTLGSRSSWSGSEVYDVVKQLETVHAPVYITDMEYVRCKGSQARFRGYTCGLWTLFHTLTVNAVHKSSNEGANVLSAMHGYVKHFFGCTECAKHFQEMAARNRIFDVKENDKAVLWLWIAHNEVNLRLAGDVTEDPEYPKLQFPSVTKCPECRLARGAWNLPAVYQYLQSIYGGDNIQTTRRARATDVSPSPFSNLDIGMLSLLYILSFIILILVIKFFLSKRYRKKLYRHGRGKV